MNIYSKRNIILPGPNGEKFRIAKDYEGPVPAWAEKSEYLKALAKDKKITILGVRNPRKILLPSLRRNPRAAGLNEVPIRRGPRRRRQPQP